MAIEWTTAEAVKKLKENNTDACIDLSKRFPLFAHYATQLNEIGAEMVSASDLSPQQWNNRLKTLASDDAGEAEEETKKPTRGRTAKPAPKRASKKAAVEEEEYDDDQEEYDDEEDDDEEPAPKRKPGRKPAAKKAAPKRRQKVEVPEPEEDDEEDYDDDDYDDLDEF